MSPAGAASRLHAGRCIATGAGAGAPDGRGDDGGCAVGPQTSRAVHWQLPVESPVSIRLNGLSLAVMMATPADLEDLAWGFLLAEGYYADTATFGATRAGEARAGDGSPPGGGWWVDVEADERALRSRRSRALEGRSGCGLCGVQELDDVVRALPHRARPPLPAAVVARAFDALHGDGAQPIRAANRSVHGAAFVPLDGAAPVLRLVREDVGRHNALDKLVGALARAGTDPGGGFAVMTSRCSFELVQKAAGAGLAGLATVSAPTTMALAVARAAGLPLAFRGDGGVVVLEG